MNNRISLVAVGHASSLFLAVTFTTVCQFWPAVPRARHVFGMAKAVAGFCMDQLKNLLPVADRGLRPVRSPNLGISIMFTTKGLSTCVEK